jgi:ATP-dependent Clp protease ATP-binding subunit ClpC
MNLLSMFSRMFSGGLAVERFSKNSQMSIALARRAAAQCKDSEVSLQYVLVGILWLKDCSAQRILSSLNVKKETIFSTLTSKIQDGKCNLPVSEIPYKYEVKQIMAIASREADRFQSPEIGTAHMLLALLRNGRGIAVEALLAHGITWQSVYDQLKVAESTSSRPIKGT